MIEIIRAKSIIGSSPSLRSNCIESLLCSEAFETPPCLKSRFTSKNNLASCALKSSALSFECRLSAVISDVELVSSVDHEEN